MAKKSKTTNARESLQNRLDKKINTGSKVTIGRKRTISKEHHASLLNAIMHPVCINNKIRHTLISRYNHIIQDLAGYYKNYGLQKQIEDANKRGETTAVSDQKYAITDGHVQDIVTHLLTILFPARQMYGATNIDPDKQNIAAAFAQTMNAHGQMFGHYSEYEKFLYWAVAFNLSVVEVGWYVRTGWRVDSLNNIGGTGNTDILMQGNKITALHPYNTILDYGANFTEYAAEAQFYAKVDKHTAFDIEKMLHRGTIFASDDVKKNIRRFQFRDGKVEVKDGKVPYYDGFRDNLKMTETVADTVGGGMYMHPPVVRNPRHSADSGDGFTEFDISKYLHGQDDCTDSSLREVHENEMLTVVMRLVPNDFGLSSSKDLQVWEFKVLNGAWIVSALQVSQEHGLLPVGITQPVNKVADLADKSIAEVLLPYQDLISNIHNLYIKNMRKNTNNGLKFYNSDNVQLSQMQDPTQGFIAVKRKHDDPTKPDTPLSHNFHTVHETPEFNNTVRDIQQIKDIMQDILPTDQLQAMADLNRATDHQSRSVSNAASRRMFKLARQISDQSVTVINYCMTQNVIQLQPSIDVINNRGQLESISPTVFKESEVEVAVSDGLRGIDTISIANRVSQVLQYAMQSRTVQQEFSVIKLLEYLMHMEGAVFNPEQFKHDNAFDALGPEEKQTAVQLLQQAAQQQQQAEGEVR